MLASPVAEPAKNGVATGLLIGFPYSTEQGIIYSEHEILAIEQGDFIDRS